MILLIIQNLADRVNYYTVYSPEAGRHSGISTICSTQKFTALHPILRVNASELIVFRLRNYSDLITFLDEVSALIDKQTLLQIYTTATEETFHYCNLVAKKITYL